MPMFKPTDVIEFTCPECGAHEYGTANCNATDPKDMVGSCHGAVSGCGTAGRSCRFTWSREDDDKYFKVIGQQPATGVGVHHLIARSVCHQPITTTGTMTANGPAHIQCWHKENAPDVPLMLPQFSLKQKIHTRIDMMTPEQLDQLWERLTNLDP